jgi:hypothetical protein
MRIKHYLITVLFFLRLLTSGQTGSQKDSIGNEICKSLIRLREFNDTTRMKMAIFEHAFNYAKKFRPPDRQTSNDVQLFISTRLHKNCLEFYDIIAKNDKTSLGVQRLTSEPKSKLKKKECRKIVLQKNLYYLQGPTDTVKLILNNSAWVDQFSDGTWSKLSLSWIDDDTFETTFTESNNIMRKNYSLRDDKYRYSIIDKTPEWYLLCVEIYAGLRYETFKVYTH